MPMRWSNSRPEFRRRFSDASIRRYTANAGCGGRSSERPVAHSLQPTVHSPLQAAFSLVEVSMALVVVAVGIFGIMSLFPAGLDQNSRSMADTRAAFFAEEVFAGMRAWSETNWANLSTFYAPPAASGMWASVSNTKVTDPAEVRVNTYGFKTFEDHVFRYRLAVRGNNLVQQATLWVYPGEFGGTNEPAIFYSEFFRARP